MGVMTPSNAGTKTREVALVALATVLIVTLPALLAAVAEPTPSSGTMRAATQPEPDYPEWLFEPAYPEPDWALLEQCWTDRFTSPNTTPEGCADSYPLTLPCDWRLSYPSRFWVEQGCGRIADWPGHFGESWWGAWEQHPARDWVARLRAGGQP